MKKRNIAQEFEIPTELFQHIEGFEEAVIKCEQPNTMERFLLMDAHRELASGQEYSDLFYLAIFSSAVKSIEGAVYEDGSEAKLKKGRRYKTISLWEGDVVDALRDEGALYLIGNYIVSQVFPTKEQKKS